MDFVTDLAEIEADTYDEPPPRNKWEAFWQRLVRSRPPCLLPYLGVIDDCLRFFLQM